MQLDIGRAFTNLFKGESWFEKILIGMLIMVVAAVANIIPYVGHLASFFVSALLIGYGQRYMRQETSASVNALPDRLPEWTDWQGLLKDGVLLQVIVICWGLLFVGLFYFFAVLFGLSALAAAGLHGLGAISLGSAIILGLTLLALLMFVTVGEPLMAAHYAHEQRFGAGFEVKTIFAVAWKNPLRTLGVFLLSVVILLMALFLATLTLGIPLVFVAQLIIANLWAQVYRLSQTI